VVLGLATVALRSAVPYGAGEFGARTGWPIDTAERLFWIAMFIAAGFFEELVYRGFAIPALRGRGVRS